MTFRTDSEAGAAETAFGAEQPAVSILIVAYNSAAFIGDCIASIITHTAPGSYEILLVDNGTDGTAAMVAAGFPQVRIIPGQGNIGFGRGNNLLASHARGELLLLLNPDTRLLDPAIDKLLAFARSQPGAAWGGLTTTPQGKLHGNFLAIPSMKSVFQEVLGLAGPEVQGTRFEHVSRPQRVDVLTGGFMMVSRQWWDTLGGFDPSFLLYSEEIDLFARLRDLGGEVWLCPDSRIVHDIGSGDLYSPVRLVYAFTGRMHYARRHWHRAMVPVIGFAYWLTALRRWLVSLPLSTFSRRHRDRFRAFTPIILCPARWWPGYAGRSSLD